MNGQYQEFPNTGMSGGVGIAPNTVVNHNLGGVYGMSTPTTPVNYGMSPQQNQTHMGIRYDAADTNTQPGFYTPKEESYTPQTKEYSLSNVEENTLDYISGFMQASNTHKTGIAIEPTKINNIKIRSNNTSSIIKSIEYYKDVYAERNIKPVYIIKDTEFSIIVKEKLNTDFLSIVVNNIDNIIDTQKINTIISDDYNEILTRILSGCLTSFNIGSFKEDIEAISKYFKYAKEEYAEDIIRVKNTFKTFIESIKYEEEDDFILCSFSVPVAYVINLYTEVYDELKYVNTFEVKLNKDAITTKILNSIKASEAVYSTVLITDIKYYASYSNIVKSIEFI